MTTTEVSVTAVPHVIWGKLRHGSDVEYATSEGSFATPRIDLDELVLSRSVGGPAFDVPVREIIAFLHETGLRLADPTNQHVEHAAELLAPRSTVSVRVLQNVFRGLGDWFARDTLEQVIENDVGAASLDGWVPVQRAGQVPSSVRAFPPRLIHVMAGNSPSAAAISITRGALSKGLNLLKLASNDLFSATAILNTMADIDNDHPTLRSFSTVYWRGGDTSIEDALFRPQFFDKLVVWGGESAIRNAVKYAGPGFEIVQYDPKMSISMIGHEAFADEATLRTVVEQAVLDSTSMNQETCASSRFHFVEGEIADVDRYCEELVSELGIDRPYVDGIGPPVPLDITNGADALAGLEPLYRVWGDYSGAGLVIRSEDPVDFHPRAKTVNVVRVDKLSDALEHVTVATQTVGLYPAALKGTLRDRLSALGVQRVVTLGSARGVIAGLPHDGHMPIQRLMHWVSDEGEQE